MSTVDLSGLNPAQQAAVTHDGGPLLLLAGAGSGKTRVVTHRIAWLLSQGVEPDSILALTFTNKAAREMQARVERLIGEEAAQGLSVSTFHSFGAKFLRSYPRALGRTRGFSIYDDKDQQALIKDCLADLGISERLLTSSRARKAIDQAKNAGRDLNADDLPPEALLAGGLAVGERYEIRLTRADAFDFGDLILRPGDLMEQDDWLREACQARWRWVMVDEFQDTNVAQYRWLRLLAPPGTPLFVVGDDDQSIYGWRGAEVSNILNFERDYPGASVVRLEQNYRSTGRILTAANAVIGHNTQRLGKSLWTEQEDGVHLELRTATDAREEARWVAGHIRDLCADEGVRPGDVAIFFRTNSLTLDVEEALRFEGLPYVVVRGRSFYDRAEVRDALAYARLLVNPADDVAFKRAVNTPPRGVGATSLKKLVAYAEAHHLTLKAAAPMAVIEGAISGRAKKGLLEFMELLEHLGQPGGRPPSEWLRALLTDSGFLPTLAAESGDERGPGAEVENVERLLVAIEAFEREVGAEASLAGWLETVKLAGDVDLTDLEQGAVSLMTVHAAKGLEFPVAFITGLEEGIFPHALSKTDAQLEEERRLCYVAITRAMSRLYLSWARARRMHGGMRFNRPSRFLRELPEEVLTERLPAAAPPPMPRRRGRGGWGRIQVNAPVTAQDLVGPDPADLDQSAQISMFEEDDARALPDYDAAQPPAEGELSQVEPGHDEGPVFVPDDAHHFEQGAGSGEFRPGQAVYHAQFGVGRVIEVDRGKMARLTVEFPDIGTRRIVARFVSPYDGV